MSVWRGGRAPGREAMGSCSSAEVEDAGAEGRAGEGRGLERYVWGAAELGGRGVGVLSRIDQALEEADCATFEDEGTITPLGSVSRRRGSQTTRGKAL